ncbi:pyrroloquinoline quinone biosynthesis peptide chaperone PqqD [Pseudarthrobacter sulfonivorans]|uniref:pyrroloquinoline quinone biosynthesis peptide chaperone PqqD n=1 Tax=Pseudarthrobacter sulfonivorans TaxID=121292 RepID=UPI00278916F4|nr:pyrroloquinoline quinone biosynthesis peptide chaperone PqqD [Pseudarthrobacter sulfonivorans]MDQ0000061.1 pyrroloquinoline quinone biosynthesis protein D [Pseudarthrobacter sulfonivorans]
MIYRHSTNVAQVRTESANRVALLHLDANQPVVLEGTAAAIWELIDGQRTVQEILAELEARFDDESGQMVSQVADFLEHLQKQHLIEPASAAGQ